MIEIGDRVEIPVWSDWWMSGSRYGEVVTLGVHERTKTAWAEVRLDNGRHARFNREDLRKIEVTIINEGESSNE